MTSAASPPRVLSPERPVHGEHLALLAVDDTHPERAATAADVPVTAAALFGRPVDGLAGRRDYGVLVALQSLVIVGPRLRVSPPVRWIQAAVDGSTTGVKHFTTLDEKKSAHVFEGTM